MYFELCTLILILYNIIYLLLLNRSLRYLLYLRASNSDVISKFLHDTDYIMFIIYVFLFNVDARGTSIDKK